ncbi:hypothetical protein A9Q89_04525 [Gammaproteobacteria bacterium 53_120_T64]|nr:hypothetical protein A9Q89_04525 [Gammaproteobacteria bacterium 53_120_T64]
MMLAGVCTVLLLGLATVGPVQAEMQGETSTATITTVNINTAGATELAAVLSNIGPSKAEAIVKYREEHGPFNRKEQLSNIKGIGESTVKKNEALIVL